ncbi:hypothetical protein H0H81_001120 [Sphagnurus paluster]|uniref:Small ribosomal subunit protein uS5m n=1 Tax=Sphagnurus paluster TaxID=117069 RepID=A0A9P7GN45_9AGAR|nr:hypothetical protein H0H81_001120 [Sphagnurus paluster]
MLSRQILCLRRVSRAGRALPPRVGLAILGKQYATAPKTTDRFDKLFATLRPSMQEDQLAMTIAALISSSKSSDKEEKLRKTLPRYIQSQGVNQESLYKKVNGLLANPPKDNFDSFVAQLNTKESPKTTSSSESSSTISETNYKGPVDDPSLIHPFDQLIEHLTRPEVRRTLEALGPDQRMEIMTHVQSIGRNPDEMEGLNQVAELLAGYQVPIRYLRLVQPAPPEAPEPNIFEEYLNRIREEDEHDLEEMDESEKQAEIRLREQDKREAEQEARRAAAAAAAAEAQQAEEAAAARAAPPPNPYPNLMVADPLLDSRDVLELPPDKDTPFHNRVIVRNHSSIFNEALAEDGFDFGADDYVPTKTDETEESASSIENLPFTPADLAGFYRFPLIHKRITQQTGKGKIHRQFVLMVVGNGDGMVGLGQGKDDDASRAEAKAYAQAVRNMDWVERFEKRTIWTDMETKLGATQLIMRPRPVGFGLRCNPNLHQVLKAAGIKDISAKVWGSRNPINVIKAAFRMLQAGHAPLAMGDGIGGPARKLNKGSGLRSKSDVERERGRQLISLRK